MEKIKKKKPSKSLFRRINDWLHLWLGLISGIIVFIIGITGSLYAFQKEIKDATEPWRFVKVQNKPFAPPGKIVAAAQRYLPDMNPSGLTYGAKNEAAAVGFQSKDQNRSDFSLVFLNPYDAGFIRKSTPAKDLDFFRTVLDGHRALWLPYKIGRPIVGIAVLIFLFLIISGLVMWWPKKLKKSHLKQAFTIKFGARFKRVNYDLHNVLGFYSFLIAAVLAITGLVFSFHWFADGVYFISSGGKARGEAALQSVPPKIYDKIKYSNNIDGAWYKVMQDIGEIKGGMYLNPNMPEEKEEPIEILVYNRRGEFYDRNEYYFDQFTLKPLRQQGDRYSEAGFADKVSMLNYDIHTGAALGFAGKLLACLISLVCASLGKRAALLQRRADLGPLYTELL